jgi:hypothetical protein
MESAMVNFLDHMRDTYHMEAASSHRDSWFPGKNVSDSLLPDMWKDTTAGTKQKSVLRLRAKVSLDEEEPLMFFNKKCEPISATDLKKGDRVCALIRLEGLWFSKASFGETYTVLQLMKMTEPEPVLQKVNKFRFAVDEDLEDESASEPEPRKTKDHIAASDDVESGIENE